MASIGAATLARVASALALAGLLAGCSSAPRLLLINLSGRELTDVEVSGQGFRTSLGRLAPDGRRTLRVHPTGESGVRL